MFYAPSTTMSSTLPATEIFLILDSDKNHTMIIILSAAIHLYMVELMEVLDQVHRV